MGLSASVYDSPLGNCSNMGLSSHHKHVTIINFDGPFNPSADSPGVVVLKGNIFPTLKVVPEELVGRHTMFGGAVIKTSDSRFREGIARLLYESWGTDHRCGGMNPRMWEHFALAVCALSLHDRVE
jgi:hypothetical protein